MNEQFYKLPEEKQQAIINAALEVFASHEYKRASTDDIAAKAGISKGLLFYYFHNKQSLYLFLYEYARQAVAAQVVNSHFEEITDFFELLSYVAHMKHAILARNPWLLDFSVRSFYPEKENSDALNSCNQQLIEESFGRYFKNVDFSKFRGEVDPIRLFRMLLWMGDGYINEQRRMGRELDLDRLMEDFNSWLSMFRALTYKEEFL